MNVRVDLKKGFCSNCRAGSHSMCIAPKCACDAKRSHPSRGAATPTRKDTTMPRPLRTVPTEQPRPGGPPVECFVREDPPPKATSNKGLAGRVTALLEGHYDEMSDGEWRRILDYGELRPRSAGATTGVLRKKCPFADVEFTARHGKVYARRRVAS